MKRNPLIALILAAAGAMAVASAKFSNTGGGTNCRRIRSPGARNPAGTKFFRKAEERRLGLPSGRRGLIVDGR